jgi:Rieske Fe-S protein
MQRRTFLKGACRICLLGAATASVAGMASSCSPAAGKALFKPDIRDNLVEIPLSLFEKQPLQVISPRQFPYEIAVMKENENSYKALLLSCTHYENQLTATGNGYRCTAHGSRFDKEGKVLNGPAEDPLKQLKTTIGNNHLLIQIK